MSVDLERQLAAYGEHLEMLAASAAPDAETSTPAAGRRGYVRGIAVAVAAAAIVFLVIGSLALFSPFSGEQIEPVADPTTPSIDPGPDPDPDPTIPSIAPDVTTPVAPIPDLSSSGLLASSYVNEVWDLALAPDGAIWAATGNGVVRWDSGVSVPVIYGEEDGLPTARTSGIVVAGDGTVWASGDGWIAYYDQAWHPLETYEGKYFRGIGADTVGGVWVVDDDHLLHIDRSTTERVGLPERFRSWGTPVVDVAVDDAGRVWMVSDDSDFGVAVYDGSSWQEFTTTDGVPSHVLSNIEIAPDGTVWIATEARDHGEPDPGEDPNVPAAGAASFNGETWTTYTTADGLASNDGEVVVAPDGTAWVTHGEAVSRFDGDTWSAHDTPGSLRSGAVGGSDGTLWLATYNGFVHFDGTDATPYTVPAEMAPSTASSFSLEAASLAAGSVDAEPFGEVRWQTFNQPVGREVHRSIATDHGFVAGGEESLVASSDGVNWTTVEPPMAARGFAASGDDLYAFGDGVVVRLAWTGRTWRAVNLVEIDGLEPDRSIEQMAFGDGVTVMTTGTQVFFSTDGSTFDPAPRGPDPALLRGAGNAGGCQPGFGGGGEEDEIGPVAAIEGGFVALSPGNPGGWNDFPLCEPVVWTSSDGSTWDLGSAESPFGPTAYVYDMAERNGRLVAVGGQGDRFTGATLWVSEDGVTWNEIPPEHIDGSLADYPVSIAAGEAGWVVLYGDALMYSLDGLDWFAPDGPPKIAWGYGVPGLVVGEDRILVTYYDVIRIGEITR